MSKKTFFLISLLSMLGLTAGTGYAARIPIPAGFPNADTTGIKGAGLTEADLTPSGAITVTTDGTIVELMNISGGVQIKANNVTIRKCKITGGLYGVHANFGYTGALVEDCTITNGGVRKGILGNDITIRRCDISEYQDGIFHGSNIIIEDNYIHDLYTAPELHNDCLQSSGDDYNITVRHNTLQAKYQDQTAAIIYQTHWGPLDNVLIENNFLSGGAYTVYLTDRGNGHGPPTNVTVKDNVFEEDGYAYGHLIYDGSLTFLCNIFHTGLPIPQNPACEPNQPPGQAGSPSPVDTATDVSTIADLSWTAGYGATSHDVYFGTTSPGTFQGNQTATTFDPGTMANDMTYYWRSDEVNTYGTTTGIVWNFTTEATSPPLPGQAANPSPVDLATNVSTTADLSWTAGSGTDSHDVYFGTTSPGTFQGNQTATIFDPGTMANDTTYYWCIDEVNAGGTTTGVVWSFTTEAASGQSITGDVADTDVQSNGTVGWNGGASERIGGARVDGLDACVVYVFQLPTVGTDEEITAANMSFYFESRSSYTPQGNADLYGIPYRSSSAVQSSDWYQGAFDGDPGATALQDNILTSSSSVGTINSDSSGNSALMAYLNTQYDVGAVAGDYVFIRVNADSNETNNPQRYWVVSMANNATASQRPVLTVTVGPVGDITGDGVVNYADLQQLTLQWLSSTPDVEVDLNGDDYIDFRDFTVLADHWLENAGW